MGHRSLLASLLVALLTFAPMSVNAEGTPNPATTAPLLLSKAQALDMARRALGIGRAELAAEIAAQILQQDPKNGDAELIRAAAFSRLGNAESAELSGRRAYRLVRTPDGKFEAAFVMASALAAQQKPNRAKLWLRHAHDHMKTEQDARLLKRAFTNLDRRTPVKLSFELSAVHTDNANGGSLHDTFWIDGVIPVPITQALPGFVAQGRAKLSYRLSKTQTQELTVYGGVNARVVRLDAKAKALDPTARSSALNMLGLDFGLSYHKRMSERLAVAAQAQISHDWLSGDRGVNRQRLKFSVNQARAKGQALSASLTLAGSQRTGASRTNTVSVAAETAYWLPLGQGGVSTRLGYTAVMAEARGVAWRGASAGVEWQMPPVVKKVDLSLFGNVQAKDFWKTASDPDLSVEIGATAQFNSVTVMGFAPSISLTKSRNTSDIAVRDTSDTNLTLGISSVF